MTNQIDTIEYSVCEDCLQVIANGYSDTMSERQERKFSVATKGKELVISDKEIEYDTFHDCELCGVTSDNKYTVLEIIRQE